MRKIFGILLAAAMVFSFASAGALAAEEPELNFVVDGEKVSFDSELGAIYVSESERTMVPLRAAAYAMGIPEDAVNWNQETQSAVFTYGNCSVSFTLDSDVCTVRKAGATNEVKMDAQLAAKDGRVYAPIRYLAEGFGFTVGWEAESSSVTIGTKGINEVAVSGGTVAGVAGSAEGVTVYKGVPFAAAPVGDLRWKAPQEVKPWEGVMICDTFSAICPQSTFAYGDFQKEFYSDPYPDMSEDCLYLNIWAPTEAADEKLPVMVYIHGGGNGSGWSYEKEFDGEGFASRDVILVTINYRHGIFGFFSHPELTEEAGGSSGNYGLMDQIAALKWVEKNIAGFGGDPENVTVFGQSAGAADVTALACSELTEGLVDKAILQSGGFLNFMGADTTLADAEAKGAQLTTDLEKSISELRKLDGNELYAAAAEAGGAYTGMCIDGYVLKESTDAVVAAGKYLDIEYMIGSNKDEMGGLFDAGTKILGDKQLELGRKPAYAYYFTHFIPGVDDPTSTCYGAFHTGECWYIFETLDRCWRQPLFTQDDYKLAGMMADYWTNFAKNGDPNGTDLPKWAPYTKDNNNIQVLDVVK